MFLLCYFFSSIHLPWPSHDYLFLPVVFLPAGSPVVPREQRRTHDLRPMRVADAGDGGRTGGGKPAGPYPGDQGVAARPQAEQR